MVLMLQIAPRNSYEIALTATTMGNAYQQCKDAGMGDFLAKPVNSQVLSLVLRNHVSPVRVTRRHQRPQGAFQSLLFAERPATYQRHFSLLS